MTPRIIHLASGREWRGGQKQAWLLARALQRRDVEQIVITTAGSELAHRLATDRVPLLAVPWTIGLDPRAAWAALRQLRPGSLFHAHDAHSLTLARLASCGRAPVVVTRRVDFPLRHPGGYRSAARVVAISERVREMVRNGGVPAEHIALVPDGVAIGDVRQTEPYGVRHRLGLPAATPLAVAVGAMVGHKDHATLVAAAALLRSRLPALHWAIAGDGPLRPAISAQIAAAGLEAQVHLLGWIPDGVAAIADGDLFVMSSREEGLGSSILDAMARGVPVVATRTGGIPDLLGNGAGLLVPVSDPAALAAGVERVATDRAFAAELVAAAARTVDRFSDAAMAERMLAVYRSVSQPTGGK